MITPDLNIELGKVPPQEIEMEEAVLGAMLLESSCVDGVLAILKPESFYKDCNQTIYRSIINLRTENKPIDLLTVTNDLKAQGKLDEVGGPVYVSMLTRNVSGSSHIEYHAMVIQDCYVKRSLIRVGSELLNMSFDPSNESDDILDYINLEVNKIANESNIENAELLKDLVSQRVRQINEICKNASKLIGIPSGLTKLDRITGGWQNTDLIILAARPSMGKTSLALFMALQAADFKIPVAFFSLEMSKMQLTDKSLSSTTEISPISIRTGKMDWNELEHGIKKCISLPLFVDDTPALTLIQLRSKITRLLKYKIQIVFIDYLQLMNARSKGLNRDQEIGELTRGIKAIAKEANIPIVLLSQLNRAADGKQPVLANLRESGNIEQDADVVLFIHRQEMCGIEKDESGNPTKGKVELIIAKHRNGPVGIVDCFTNEHCSKFYDNEIEQMNAF